MPAADCRLFRNGNTLHAVPMIDSFRGDMKLTNTRCNTAELGAGTTTTRRCIQRRYEPLWHASTWSAMFGNGQTHHTMMKGISEWHVVVHGITTMTIARATSYDFFSNGYAEFVIGFRIVQ